MSDQLNVSLRDSRGTIHARRQRSQGSIPAVLYGHGEENVCLSIPASELEAVVRHGAHVVDLKGALEESALIKEIQWNAFGTDVLHVDLTRVKAGESIEVDVLIDLRGEAPGTKVGGVLQQSCHEVTIRCPVASIPEKLELNINSLELSESMTASQLELPDGATLVSPPDTLIVQCAEAVGEEEPEEAVPSGAAEPEVIGRKPEEEEESSD